MDWINAVAHLLNKTTVRILATLVWLVALVTLIAWYFNIQWLFQLAPDLVAMQHNTALCFFLLSLSLLCYSHLRWATLITNGLVLLIALLTICEYIFHVQLGLDELFVTAHSFKETAYPGRMAPNTAVSFVLLNISLFSVQTMNNYREWSVIAFTLCVAVIAIGLLALTGYALDISIAYSWGNWTNMSPQTAVSFILLATGLALAYLIEQPLDLNRREIILPVLIIGIGLVFCLLSWQALSRLNHEQLKFNLRNHGKLIASEILNNLSWHQYSVNQLLVWQGSAEQNRLVPDTSHVNKRLQSVMALIAVAEYPELVSEKVLEELTPILVAKKLTRPYQGLVQSCLSQRHINYVSRTEEAATIVEQANQFLLCMSSEDHSRVAIMDLEKVFDQITKRLLVNDTGLAILKNNKSVYQVGEDVSPAFLEQWKQVLPLPMGICDCELAIWPTQNYILKNSRWIAEGVIVFGLLITILLGIVLHYWLVSRKEHRFLQKIHRRSKKIFSENKLLYEQILDAGTDGWWDWQLDVDKEYLSPKLKHVLGYGVGDILDQPKGWQKIMRPKDLQKVVENFRQHIHSDGKIPFYQEVRYQHKLGYWVWVIVRGQGIQDEDGKFRRMIGTHTDISRLKKTQADLSRSMMELNLMHRITAYAARTTDVNKALQHCVNLICESLDWPIGHAYAMDEQQQCLVSRKIWYLKSADNMTDLIRTSEIMTYQKGDGFPGMIWEQKNPIWLETLPSYKKCERMEIVKRMNIQSAAGFPIMIHGKVIAVLELFSFEKKVANSSYIKTLAVIGEQLGHVFERHQHEQSLDIMAHYDSVTVLPNRRYFYEVLERRLAKSTRVETKFAVLFIDFDNFKSINDNLGHDCGDKLLKKFAEILQKEVRGSDFTARLSGDEFIVLADPIAKSEDAGLLAKRIQQALKHPIQLDEHWVTITISIGIALYFGGSTTANELVQNADNAMYTAKKHGKNNYQYFTSALQKKYEQTFMIEQQLHGALQRNEFSLVYQPIIDLQSQKTMGIEALLRWHNPALGEVSPEDFIDTAEENGLILDIGAWVLQQACMEIAQLQVKYPKLPICLSINVSPIQLQQRRHLQKIKRIMTEIHIPPQQIIFEITENRLMQYMGEPGRNLDELMALGVQIAIDDFGVGYSSFKYLKMIPFSILKIDKSFIENIGKNNTDDLIIQGIIGLARSIGLRAIAEGVETQQQLDFLCEHHCDCVQGYFISVPLTMAKLETWMAEHG
ncbi:MAG: EAL domain-containing protein [Legionellales bacterium]|nr:EAL domain-containing protein [Legionellales bacterium]